jgi:tetratricopeptide (TPR) repeat protein
MLATATAPPGPRPAPSNIPDVFDRAVWLHRRERLDRAAHLYQTILAHDPEHAGALHLLGVIALQRGNPMRAVGLIGRAIALEPGAAAFHANLAEAYRTLGRLDQAAACNRLALELQPDFAEAAANLGAVLLALGDGPAAIEPLRRAVSLRPGFALAHNNLGNALRLLADKAAALECFRRAVELDPALAEARTNLGQMLLEHNRPHEALPHCQEAARLRPDLAEVHNNLGNVLRALDRLNEAKACYAEALRIRPDFAMVHNNMGQALQEESQLDDALAWYDQALAREPSSARFHANRASALAEQDREDEAAAGYETALCCDPAYAPAHNGLGLVREGQGRYDEALACFRAAARLQPDLAGAHANLGSALEQLGDFGQALACFREALRHDPEHAGARAMIATLERDRLPQEEVADLRRRLAKADLSAGKRCALSFGIAQILDGRGGYVEAAEHLRVANALRLEGLRKAGRAYEPEVHREFVDGIIGTFMPEFFARVAGGGIDSERPVFIVGLPRSGTTLTEQILASHPRAYGAGELRFLRQTFEAIPETLGGEMAALECLPHLGAAGVRGLAQRHLERLAGLNDTADRVVDKMPDNYLYLGLIAALFPRARIIHCRRDLRDVAVSCWMTNFRQIPWAFDTGHIASRFEQYRRVTGHWRQVLPVEVLEVDYEETVADLEGVARRLVDWCGLEWDPACLKFHENRRPVRTASLAQVRRPIYRTSVARWKHYEEALGELFARL